MFFNSVQAQTKTPTSEAAERPVGIFEPPRGLVLISLSRHKLTILAVAIVFAVLGVLAGFVRKPTYTARTTLQVGTVNLNAPGFAGFVEGATALSTVFSRAIFASPVLAELHAKLGISPAEASKRLSAEPIPLSPSFDIVATGTTSKGAIALANTTSKGVVAYEQKAVAATSPQATALLKQYDGAAQELQQAHALVQYYSTRESLERARDAKAGRSSSSMPSRASIRARAAEDEAKTHAEAIGASYKSITSSTAAASPAAGVVSIVAEATTSAGNRKSKVELYGLLGLLAGIIIGCAAAVLRERRRAERMISAEWEDGIHRSQPAS